MAPSDAALGRALGRTGAAVRAWKQKHGDRFPAGPPYDVEAVRRFVYSTHARSPARPLAAELDDVERVVAQAEASSGAASRRSPPPKAAPPPAPVSPPRAPAEGEPSSDSDAGSLEGLVAVRDRVRGLMDAAGEDDPQAAVEFPRLADLLNRVEDQIRKRESAEVELRKARAEVVDRDEARVAVGQAIVIARQEMEALIGALGPRVVQWMADDRWRALPTADRVREVYQWAEKQVRAVAALDVDELLTRASVDG